MSQMAEASELPAMEAGGEKAAPIDRALRMAGALLIVLTGASLIFLVITLG